GPGERYLVGELIERGRPHLDRSRRDRGNHLVLLVAPLLVLNLDLDLATGPRPDLARELADVLADGAVDRDRQAHAQRGGLRPGGRGAEPAQQRQKQTGRAPHCKCCTRSFAPPDCSGPTQRWGRWTVRTHAAASIVMGHSGSSIHCRHTPRSSIAD